MRASYQDSNIFKTERSSALTVQKTATADPKDIRTRTTDTFNSNQNKVVSDNVKERDQLTFVSTVFGAAIQNKVNRTKLGAEDGGTENLFGVDKVTYEKTSENAMIPKTKS